MACYEPCEYKKEASMLRKQLKALDPERVEEKLASSLRAKLHAVNERDCARRKVQEKQRIIGKLREEIESLKDRLVWAEEDLQEEKKAAISVKKDLKRQIDKLEKDLSAAVWRLEKQKRDLEKAHKKELKQQKEEFEKKLTQAEERHQKELAEKDEIIKALTEHPGNVMKDGKDGRSAKSTKNDSRNSSVSPGQDPNHATITNNREPSGLKPGGQPGHSAHPRKKLKPTKIVELPPPKEVLENPDDYYRIDEVRKQVVSVGITVEVTEYVGSKYRNHKTRKIIHSEFPEGARHLEVNYDETVESLAAYLHSVCNVPYNKIQELFNDAVEGGTLPVSIGKLAGLEKKFSALSEEERNEIWGTLFRSKVMNIDGTCIRINGKQRQVLVMRSGNTVMYKMTGCKGNKALEGTPAEHYGGTVVSDGESTFIKLGKKRQGCLIHEGRYCRHAEEVARRLEWAGEMRGLLKELQHRRKEDIKKDIWKMPKKERKQIEERYERILRKGLSEYEELCGNLLRQQLLSSRKRLQPYSATYDIDFDAMKLKHKTDVPDAIDPETKKALRKNNNTLIRLITEKKSYLLFLSDYTIPPHNNDAEKAARVVKIHTKPNGGMRSEVYAGYYADMATVMETGHMHGQSRFSKMKEVFARSKKTIIGHSKKH